MAVAQEGVALRTFFLVGRRGQTWRNVLYLFLCFPLGITYFTLLVSLVSTGIGLVVVGVGIVLLGVTMWIWWLLAVFERAQARALLGIQIDEPPPPDQPGQTLWRRIQAYAGYAPTWKGLLFVLAKFPMGIVSFAVLVAGFSLVLSLIFLPVSYAVNVYINNTAHLAPFESYTITIWGQLILVGTSFAWSDFLKLLPATLAGLLLWYPMLHGMNGLGWLYGQFARVMLGASESDRRVAEARATAARAQAQAQAAERSRQELIMNVSHELRTPIANIRGHVDSLLMATEAGGAPPPPQEAQRYVALVARAPERLGDLVDDLLTLARGDAAELPLIIAPTNVAAVAREVCDALAPLARNERQVRLVCEADAGLPPARADRQRLAQVLLNLVRNAIVYTPEGGIVAVRVFLLDQQWIEVDVADTGMGIAPEDLPRVFERFYRTDASRARELGGFGLGLSIARELVRAMGGSLDVRRTVGEGTTFRVALPVAR